MASRWHTVRALFIRRAIKSLRVDVKAQDVFHPGSSRCAQLPAGRNTPSVIGMNPYLAARKERWPRGIAAHSIANDTCGAH